MPIPWLQLQLIPFRKHLASMFLLLSFSSFFLEKQISPVCYIPPKKKWLFFFLPLKKEREANVVPMIRVGPLLYFPIDAGIGGGMWSGSQFASTVSLSVTVTKKSHPSELRIWATGNCTLPSLNAPTGWQPISHRYSATSGEVVCDPAMGIAWNGGLHESMP